MAFSELELVFLALIFIFALGFLMSLLGARDNTSTVKKTKKKRKGRKRATRRHCQDHQTTKNLIILEAQYSGETF